MGPHCSRKEESKKGDAWRERNEEGRIKKCGLGERSASKSIKTIILNKRKKKKREREGKGAFLSWKVIESAERALLRKRTIA